ncbi:MAG: DUF4224 domain-containing protein [Pseudomonadota bacterium]
MLTLIFLNSDEIKDLTDLKSTKAQIRWLINRSYPFEIGASGQPKVLRSFLINKLQEVSTTGSINEPNFDAIR